MKKDKNEFLEDLSKGRVAPLMWIGTWITIGGLFVVVLISSIGMLLFN